MTGCHEQVIPDSEINKYYEINRQNSVQLFSTVIKNKKTKNNRFKIVHISDSHVSKWSSNNNNKRPQNIIEAVKFANQPELKFNAMVFTGDFIGNSIKTPNHEALTYLSTFSDFYYLDNKIPSFVCTGNHDANMLNSDTSQAVTSKEIYTLITSKINYPIHAYKQSNYYYADIPNQESGRGIIRLIAIDVLDQSNLKYDSQHYALTSQQQIDWLCNIALKENMTDSHSVVILVHHPLSSKDPNARIFIADEYQYGWTMIPEIIEAFRSKKPLSRKYKNRLNKADTLFVNTSFENTPGEFICYMGGHAHTYLDYRIDGLSNANPNLPKQIMVIANNMSPSDKNPKSPIIRSGVGLKNNTFNIYAIDTHEKKIYITFFGATLIHHPEIITLRYL